MSRLLSVFPALAEAVRGASANSRWQAALVGLELAVSWTALEGPEVISAIGALRLRSRGSRDLQRQLRDLAGRLDDKYLLLLNASDRQQRPRWCASFRRHERRLHWPSPYPTTQDRWRMPSTRHLPQ